MTEVCSADRLEKTLGKLEIPLLLTAILIFLYLTWQIASLPGSDGLPSGVGYISDEVWYVTSARNILHDVFKTSGGSPYYTTLEVCVQVGEEVKRYEKIDVVTVEGNVNCYVRRGFPYPDREGILNYYNFEHPPLVKYIIAVLIAIRDEPPWWRLPSIAAGVIVLVLVYLIVKKTAGTLWALTSVFLMLLDRTFVAMSSVAMLDIYLAMFTALLAYLYITKSPAAVGVALGLATSVKYSGAFPIFGLIYLYAKRSAKLVLTTLVVAAVVFLLANAPMVMHLGLWRWLGEIHAAISWHTTSRPPGPTASTPVDWLIMQNNFAIYLNPDVYASGTLVYLVALVFSLYRRDDLSILYLSTYGGYWLVYLAGNHTLYSFYAAHFSPLAHVVFGRFLAWLSGVSNFERRS